MRRPVRALTLTAAAGLFAAMAFGVTGAIASGAAPSAPQHESYGNTATPIKHLVVIFDENVSFDHYFGTYPYAPNPPGEPAFHAKPGTPLVNGLYNAITKAGPVGPLLTNNPNGSNPVRLDHGDPETCDQDHNYTPEQLAADHGAEDAYPANTGNNLTLAQCLAGHNYLGVPETVPAGTPSTNAAVMDYYDGNSVTGLWNYAQQYAMSDNMYGTTFGPSTPGALNVTSAQTYGAICASPTDGSSINAPACAAPAGLNTTDPAASNITAGPAQPPGPGTVIGDDDPTYDICSYLPGADRGDGDSPAGTITMGGKNIGDELTASNTTWGWFEGGFDNGYVPGTGQTQPTTAQICSEAHQNVGGVTETDYSPHHEPFEYYASTANPMHLPPTSVAMVGQHRPGQPPVRHRRLLRGRRRWQPARGLLSQGTPLPGRARQQLRPAGRADLARRHDRPPSVAADLELHRSRHHLGRLRRLVRQHPRAPLDPVSGFLDRRADRPRALRQRRLAGPGELGPAARAGQVRPRPAAAVPGDLALREVELRVQHPDRPELDCEVHRVQLAPASPR